MSVENINAAFELLKDELFHGMGDKNVNDVFDCLLEVNKSHKTLLRAITDERGKVIQLYENKKAPRYDKARTVESQFKPVIISVLQDSGGTASARSVISQVYDRMKEGFTHLDLVPVPSGELRWRNTLRWSVAHLKAEGVIASGTSRGIWRLN